MNPNIIFLLTLAWFVIWMVALLDCLTRPYVNKFLWAPLITIVPFLGSVLYFALCPRNVRHSRRNAASRRRAVSAARLRPAMGS